MAPIDERFVLVRIFDDDGEPGTLIEQCMRHPIFCNPGHKGKMYKLVKDGQIYWTRPILISREWIFTIFLLTFTLIFMAYNIFQKYYVEIISRIGLFFFEENSVFLALVVFAS